MDLIWNMLMFENLDVYKVGFLLLYIIMKLFMEVFIVGMGGFGMILVVVIVLVFLMKSK